MSIVWLFCCAVAVSAETADFNALKPKGRPGEELVLTERTASGRYPRLRSRYEIVLPARATTQEQKAAFELEHWLEAMTGVMFPVVADTRTGGRKSIHIGHTQDFLKAGISEEGLGDEGYAIVVRDGNLFLTGGRRRGPINAVFALLEEDLGCRWLPGDVDVISRTPEPSFRPVPRRFTPKLEGREPFYWESLSQLWSLRNRTNSTQVPIPEEWGGCTFWALRTHSHLLLVPTEKYFHDHPEYYGLERNSDRRNPRVLCLTNPALVHIAVEGVRRVLRQNPTARAIMIAKEDGGSHGCFCPRCTAIDEAEGTQQANHLMFVNAIAEALEKEFPDVLFCNYAYTYTLKAPKTVRPRRNVGIRLCNNDTHPDPFTSVADHAGFQETFRGWKAISDKIFIYDYWQNPSHPYTPLPNLEMIARNIRWFAAQGVREVSGLGTATWYPRGDRTPMRTWVTAKLLWDPAWDLRDLMRDFNVHYYGKAAEAMTEYDQFLEASLKKHWDEMRHPPGGRRFPMTVPLYSPQFLDRAGELLDRADRLAESDAVRQRIKDVRRTIEYVRTQQAAARK